jgi:hypothetical protein
LGAGGRLDLAPVAARRGWVWGIGRHETAWWRAAKPGQCGQAGRGSGPGVASVITLRERMVLTLSTSDVIHLWFVCEMFSDFYLWFVGNLNGIVVFFGECDVNWIKLVMFIRVVKLTNLLMWWLLCNELWDQIILVCGVPSWWLSSKWTKCTRDVSEPWNFGSSSASPCSSDLM